MIHVDEDCEGLERVQLDDYDDYLLDILDQDMDVTMDSESSDNIKAEDADDIQKNTVGSSMQSTPNAGTVRSRQTCKGVATSMTPPRATLASSSMLAGTLAVSSLPGIRSTKKWKHTAPPAINSLSTT
jgi:hypothetical protein